MSAGRQHGNGTTESPIGSQLWMNYVASNLRLRTRRLSCRRFVTKTDGRIEYRLGYYMIGVKPRMAGKWTWGQYATLIPARDFRALIKQAERRDWI